MQYRQRNRLQASQQAHYQLLALSTRTFSKDQPKFPILPCGITRVHCESFAFQTVGVLPHTSHLSTVYLLRSSII